MTHTAHPTTITDARLDQLRQIAGEQPDPLAFATVSGAHLYGFPSPDSDYDLRGVHVLPATAVLGLGRPEETREVERLQDGIELDLVTHDLKKFLTLLLRPNGYVLEQLTSPLVVRTSPLHDELLALVPDLVTRHHAKHYRGFFGTQWKLLTKEPEPRVKPLLYCYRVLLTGLHLMRTGRVQADLRPLLAEYPQPGVAELVELKVNGREKEPLPDGLDTHGRRTADLLAQLDAAAETSGLPEHPRDDARCRADALLVGARLGG